MGLIDDVEKKMKEAIAFYETELKGLRTGRPNPSILDQVRVEIYGTTMSIKELGSVSVSEGRQLLVTPFTPQQTAGAIHKSIEKANLNLQPILDGNVIRIPFPQMSEELRKEIAKDAKAKGEKAKVVIRAHRKDGNELLKKQKADGEITEDVQKKEKRGFRN